MNQQGQMVFKRWTHKEEVAMVSGFQSGKQVAEISKEHGRSTRAILIRLGAILARSPDHPDHIRTTGLNPVILASAREAYNDSQTNTATPTNTTPSVDTQKILDSIEEVRAEVRKLRAQMRNYYKGDGSNKMLQNGSDRI